MTIATLKDCNRCGKLKSELTSIGINFQEIDCESFPDFCDRLESVTKTYKYPMIISGTGNTRELHYVTDVYQDLKLLNEQRSVYILKPYFSLEQMIENLKQKK
jgi:glutaredoxin